MHTLSTDVDSAASAGVAPAEAGPPTSTNAVHWSLRGDMAHLNHGSFGACPSAILEYQRSLQDELERDPVDFLVRQLPDRLAEARAALGAFVGALPDDLAFVTNATQAVNAVVRSLAFSPGDELLTTDHAYGACRKTLDYVASRTGAKVVVARAPFPLAHEDEVLEVIVSAITPRTRLAMIDHVTSPTALVFPIRRIVDEVQRRGVDVLVDGAHAVGMVPLALDELGAAYYTSNAHKWLCAPKGAAFLHVRGDRQHLIHPTTISHGYDPNSGVARFREEFDWVGTVDPMAPLCIPECIRFVADLVPGGWDEVMRRNGDLARRARMILCHALGIDPPCPERMLGTMAAVSLPEPAPNSPASLLDHEKLPGWFRERGVEVAVFPWACASGKLIRVSAQLYNNEEQFIRVAGLVRQSLGRAWRGDDVASVCA